MAFGDEFSMNRSAYLALMAGDAYKKINDFQVPSISNQTITDLGDTSMVASTLATQGDFIGRQTLQSNQSTGTSTMADNTPDATTDSNWWDKITNFFNAIGNSINEGILDFADSIGDAAITIGSWFTPDDTWAENAIKTDWQAPVLKALDSYSTMSNPLNWINAAVKGENASDYWNSLWGGDWTPSGARQSLNEKKYDTFLSNGAMDVATGIGNAVGQIAPNVALAVATGGATVPAQMAIQGGLGVVQGLGSGAETAVNEGASMNQASLYGAIQGGIGGIVSAVSAGIGGTLSKGGQGAIGAASKKTGNWFIGKVGGKIADASSRKTAEVLMGKTTEVLLDAGFDGASTFIQSSLDPVFKQITYDQNALEKAYGSSDAIKNTFAQAGIAAAISFAASGIVGAAREGYSYIKDGKENYQNLYFDQKTLAYMNKTERKALQGAIDDYNNKIKPLQDTLDGLSARQFTAGDDAGNAELTSLRYQTLDKLDKATREYNEKYANTLNAALDGIHKVSNTGDSSNLEKAIRYQNDRVAKITGDIDNFRGFVKYYMDNESKGKTPRLYGPDESAFTLNDGSQYPQIPSSSAPTSLPSPTGGLPLLPSEGGNALAMPRLTYKSTLVQGRNVDLAIGASSIDNLTPVLKPKSEAAVFESLNFTETHKNSIAPKQVEFDAKAIDPSLEGTIIAKPIESKTHDTAIDLQSVSDNGEEKSWRGKLFPADDWQGQYYFSVNSDDVMYIDKYRSRRTATMEEIKAKSRSFNEFLKEQKIKSLSKTSPEEIAQRKGKESSNEYKDENSKFLDFKGTIDGKTQKFRIKAGNEKIFILDTDGKWVDSKLTLDQLNDISRGFSKIYVNIKDKSVDGVFSFIKEKRLKKKSKESVVQKRKLSINSTEKERIEALKGKKLKMISLKGEAFQESTIKKGKSKWRSESLKFLKESVDLEKIKNEEYLIGDTGLRGKLSSKSIGESIENSKSLGALKIALAHLKEVLTNSIEIEEHLREGYKGKNDKNLKAYIELVSIIDTKNYLLPIKIGVKDFGISNDRNVIYTVTALTPIHKKGWGLEGRNSSSSLTPAHPSNIILEDLIEKVKDQELLKYFPKALLPNGQLGIPVKNSTNDNPNGGNGSGKKDKFLQEKSESDNSKRKNLYSFKGNSGELIYIFRDTGKIRMLKKGSSKWMDLDPNNIAEVGKLSKGLQKVTQASGAKTVQQLLQYFDDQRKSKPKVEKEIETWPNKKSKISVESTNEDRRRILSKEEAKIISIETSKDIANEINELENSFSDPDKINPSISYEKFKELNQGDFFKRIDGDKFEKIKIPALGIEGQFTVRSIKESIKKSNYLVGEYYVLKNAEKILKEAKIIEIHNDHKLEKNENVLSVVAMVSFVKLDNELIPVKIIVKSYGEKADVPYKIYVFSARKEPKRDLLLQHRHLANAAIIHKSLQSINILDFFSVSRDFELFKYSPLELSKEQQSIVDKEKAKKERRLMAKEEKSLEPVEGNIGFEGGSSGGNGGNGGGKPPLPPSSLPPSGNDGNDGGDKGNKKPKGLPKSESQEINPYIEGRGREDSSSDDKSSARLIKDSANARKEKVYSLSDVRKALDTLTKEVGKLGEKNNFTEKDVKELFNALNIKDVETQDKAVSDFIDRLAERTYDIDGTEVSHIFDDNEKAELKQRLAEFLKSSGKPSELRKALDAFNDTVSRMNRSISRWKLKADTRVKYAKELSKLRSNEDKLKRGQTPAGQVVVGPLAMFDNAYKAMRLSKVDYGISENTFRGVSDALKGYNEDIFLDNPTMPYMYNSELRADVDTIDRYLNLLDSQKAIRAEKDDALEDASKAMVDLIGRINYEISEAQENFSLDMRKMNAVANEELNLFDYSTKGKKIGSIFTNVINNFISPGEVFATYIGLDSNITKLFTTDALEAIGNKYAMYLDFKDRYLSEKAIGFKTSVLKKKMKTKIGGNEIDIGTAALIYASSLSPSNKEEMLKYHIKLKDLKGKQTRTVEMTQNDLDSITAELPDNVKKWADKLYSDFYNGEASKTYKEKYLEFTGVEPDMEEGYFPRRRGDLTQKGIDASNTNWSPKYMNGLDQPFNKARTNSHNPLDFTDDLYTFTDNYIKELSVFATETPYMKKFDSLNTKFATKSVISRISELIPEGGKMVDYWIKRFLEVPTSKGDNTFADLMSKSITALFGLNFSSAAKQVISSLKIPLMTGWRAYAYGLIHGLANLWPGRYGKTIEDITTRSGLMKSRFTDNEILKANTLVNKVGKIGKVTGFLMNAIDQMVIVTTAWSAAQYKAQELGFGKIGTSENKDKAAKILDEIVLKTQSNSESIDVSRIRGGDLGTFSKMLFGMFGADNQKMLEWINDATRKDNYTAARLKHYDELFDHFEEKIKEQDDVLNNPESSERERQEAQAKKENYESMKETFRKRQEADKEAVSPRRRAKKIAVVLGIMLLSAGMSAGITALVNKYLKGKDVKGQDVAMDFASESVSWIPYLGTIVNAILNKQDSLNAASLSSLNNLLSLAQQLYTTGSKGTWDADKMKLVYKGLSAFGSLTGLPFKNLLDYSSGISKTWGGTWGDQFYNWVHGYDSSVIVARAKSDYESGDLTSATKSISTLMTLYKSGSVDWDTSREIARLYGEKLSVMPKNYMTEYKDENGDTKTLTQGQLSSFQKEYSKANKIAEKLIKTSEYKALSDDGKARALKKLFDSFYDSAKSKALGIQASSKLGQILSLSGGDIDLANIILLMQQLASLTTDQKSTRKEKAVKVVNSATDMDKGERLLSLWLDGYGLDDQSTSYLRKYLVGLGADSKLVSQTID